MQTVDSKMANSADPDQTAPIEEQSDLSLHCFLNQALMHNILAHCGYDKLLSRPAID